MTEDFIRQNANLISHCFCYDRNLNLFLNVGGTYNNLLSISPSKKFPFNQSHLYYIFFFFFNCAIKLCFIHSSCMQMHIAGFLSGQPQAITRSLSMKSKQGTHPFVHVADIDILQYAFNFQLCMYVCYILGRVKIDFRSAF